LRVPGELNERLNEFRTRNSFTNKGAIAVALVVTRHAKKRGLPLDARDLVTKEKGQVLGLGKGAVQAILKDHDIERTLAEEGGRTSRGSLGNMERYVEFLNELHYEGLADLEEIEKWWIARVRDFFAGQGFAVIYDASKSLRNFVDDLLSQATRRQREATGTMYVGTILQHLVGAKLALMLGDNAITHHGASVADAPSLRQGDFTVEDVCIHVSAAPNEGLMEKCRDNLNSGLKALIVTTREGFAGAQSLASIKQIAERVDIIEAGQFISTNVYEWSRFKARERKITVERLIEKYNDIVTAHETDPSLRIKLGR
jgi:Domain of unknown function (DUF4928)